MSISILTAMELVNNYPDNILIESCEQDGKYSSFCFRLKNKESHKLVVSTEPCDTKEEAEKAIYDLIEACKKHLEKAG